MDRSTGQGFRPLLVLCALVSCLLAMASRASAKTAMQEYVDAMQPGWNLGNTLDATPNETSWGNPLTTQALIHQIKQQGFKSIRIPVSWDPHVGAAPTYTVDPAWMDRVQQIVDWSLAEGLYVMLNMHHDSYWIREQPANYLTRYATIWQQIATRFRDHSDKLMLETINEPDFLNVSDATKITLVNQLNTTAFNVIRATGGGNATRPIVMPTVVTNGSQQYLDALKATMLGLNDPNLIATIHFYGYWPFSVNIAGVTTVDASTLADINNTFTHAHDTFVAAGIPVVVGELGILAWDTGLQGVERGELLKFFEIVTATTKANELTWQIWDNGSLFDRLGYVWKDPEQMGYILGGVTGRSATGATDLIFVKDGVPADTAIPINLNGNSFVSLTNGATTLTPGVDYTFDAGVLTVKAGALAAYASGAFGEQAVFTANFSAGMPWKLHVRHLGVAALSAVTGNKSSDVVIQAAFNGDLVATMEAKYVNGDLPYPGPQNWTSFKEYTDAYLPNYANNTLTLKKRFFDNTTNNPIDLTIYFWSGRIEHYRLTLTPAGDVVPNPQEKVLYSDGLSGWYSWGWGAIPGTPGYDPDSTSVVHSGTKAISLDAGAYGAFVMSRWEAPVDTSAYKTLVFWINGGSVGGQTIGIGMDWSTPWVGVPTPAANTWTKVEIPLSALGVEGRASLDNLMVQNWTGGNAPTFYIDDIYVTTAYASYLVFVDGAPAPVITSATTAVGTFNSPFSYSTTAINTPTSFSAADLPGGLAIDAGTGVISGTPTAAGLYLTTVTATNAAGDGSQIVAIRIAPAPATFTLPAGNSPFNTAINAAYDGAPQGVKPSTSPANIPVTITYNGSTTTPTLPGTYHVVVTSNDPNYTGTTEGTLVITVTALVRHAPALSGDVDGSLQLLSGESFAVNNGVAVSDLLVPGTPAVQLNGKPLFGGIINAGGAAAPANYSVTLNNGSVVRSVVRRVDPIAMPVVVAPALPLGTRSVTLTSAGQSFGAAATLRDLTLSASAGAVPVPAGVYGNFAVNGSNTLVLGVQGATVPAVYELQSLTMGHNASVKIVGPVTLKLASGLTLDGPLGSAAHPDWFDLQIASGGLIVNGGATVNGVVTVPTGTVTINGTIYGRVNADRLTINGSGVLEDAGL